LHFVVWKWRENQSRIETTIMAVHHERQLER
jgi:hypothetical protein